MWPKQHVEESPVSCAWTQERLLGYLDGDLAPHETQRLHAHLDGCSSCRQEIVLTRRAESLLSSALSTAPPAGDLRSGFYARLAASSASPRRQIKRAWIAVPALSGAFLAVLLITHFHISRTAATGATPWHPPVTVADHPKLDPAFLLAALPSPIDAESSSSQRASVPHITAKEPQSLAANSYGRGNRRNDARHEWKMALVTSIERSRPRVTKFAGMSLREKREMPTTLASSQFAENNPDHTETAKLVSAGDEVDFSVRDDVRGFTAGTHVTSLPAAADGDHVVIIEEKSDSLPAPADQGSSAGF